MPETYQCSFQTCWLSRKKERSYDLHFGRYLQSTMKDMLNKCERRSQINGRADILCLEHTGSNQYVLQLKGSEIARQEETGSLKLWSAADRVWSAALAFKLEEYCKYYCLYVC